MGSRVLDYLRFIHPADSASRRIYHDLHNNAGLLKRLTEHSLRRVLCCMETRVS
jgi:hypothetical protein